MKFALAALTMLSVGSFVKATYPSRTVGNYMAYARIVSKSFARGDVNDASGWRECIEVENTPKSIGVACEGLRTFAVHGGRMVDANYFCEFQFFKVPDGTFRIEMELCQ